MMYLQVVICYMFSVYQVHGEDNFVLIAGCSNGVVEFLTLVCMILSGKILNKNSMSWLVLGLVVTFHFNFFFRTKIKGAYKGEAR